MVFLSTLQSILGPGWEDWLVSDKGLNPALPNMTQHKSFNISLSWCSYQNNVKGIVVIMKIILNSRNTFWRMSAIQISISPWTEVVIEYHWEPIAYASWKVIRKTRILLHFLELSPEITSIGHPFILYPSPNLPSDRHYPQIGNFLTTEESFLEAWSWNQYRFLLATVRIWHLIREKEGRVPWISSSVRIKESKLYLVQRQETWGEIPE